MHRHGRARGVKCPRELVLARYYFHLRDHKDRLLDPQGQLVDEPELLPQIALAEARAIISADALQGEINLDQRLEIEDEDGRIVHMLRFGDAVQIVGYGR